MSIPCIHCGALTTVGDAFCQSCGKALPTTDAAYAAPTVVEGSSVATTAAGQEMQAEELKKKMRGARTALIIIAVLQLIGVFLIPVLLENQADQLRAKGMRIDRAKLDQLKNTYRMTQIGVTVVFFALGIWAGFQPFPAAIVGLILMITLWVLAAIQDPSSIIQGILLKVIILGVLIKAVQAGVQYQALQKASESKAFG